MIEGKSLGLSALMHSYRVFPEGIEPSSEVFAVRAGAFSVGKEAFAVAITSLSWDLPALKCGIRSWKWAIRRLRCSIGACR